MKAWIITILLAIAPLCHAKNTGNEGVALQPEIIKQGHSLVLNGAGERTKFFTGVYIASLYLTQGSQDPSVILTADTPQMIRLDITSSMITKNLLMSSIKDGLKLSAGKDYAKYAKILDDVFDSAELSVNDGDQFDFFYTPEYGTHITVNNQPIKAVPGLGFKQVLFGIWIGKKPIQTKLKRQLLKGPNASRSTTKRPDTV